MESACPCLAMDGTRARESELLLDVRIHVLYNPTWDQRSNHTYACSALLRAQHSHIACTATTLSKNQVQTSAHDCKEEALKLL